MARPMDQVISNNKRTWATYLGDGAFKFIPKKWHRVRFYGLVTSDFRHNVPTLSKKSYPEYCHGYDVDADQFYDDRDERCEACARKVPGVSRYFMNLIDVEMEENKPAKAPVGWSPVKMAELSKTLFERLQNLRAANKQYPITHPKHGAIVLIQYDPDADPAQMYGAQVDDKDVALTDEQCAYVIEQMFEDGNKKTIKGANGEPPQYTYIRCVNTLQDMTASLNRNQVGMTGAKKLPSLDTEDENPKVEEEKLVAKAASEMSINQAPDTLKRRPQPAVEEDDTPPPPPARKAAPAPVAAPVEEEVEEDVVDESALAHAECPASFGKFASANLCFTKCKARKPCREISLASKKASKVVKKDDDEDAV